MNDLNIPIPGLALPDVTTPAPAPEAAPSPATPSPNSMLEELSFLEKHGEDVSDLRSDLESFLRQRQTQPEPQAQPQAQPQTAPLDPQVQPAPAPVVSQEQALDPYAPNASQTKQPNAEDNLDVEPGEVMIDQDGKVRDARTGKYVPHQAFHSERLKRQQAEASLQKKNEEFARAEERLAMLTQILEGQQKAQAPATQAPADAAPAADVDIDPEVDIFGAFKQLMARNKVLQEQIADTKKTTSQHLGQMQMVERYRQDVTKFSSETPDFFDAYRYLTQTRQAELRVLGFTDERAIGEQLVMEERNLASTALGKGKSAAQMMYELAKAKGYRAKSPEPAPVAPAPPPPPPMPQVQAQPAMATLQADPAAVARVQQLQNGMRNSATLSGSGGSPGEGLTVQQLIDMNEDDFMAFAGKMGMTKLDNLLRG